MLFNNCQGNCPQIPKMSLFKRGIPKRCFTDVPYGSSGIYSKSELVLDTLRILKKVEAKYIHLKKRVHLLGKFNFFLNHSQLYGLLEFRESFCRSLKTSSNPFFSNGANSVASKNWKLIIHMGKRVYWKGKVRHFINYSESYGLLQFKKSVSETSSLVQIHYFLIK